MTEPYTKQLEMKIECLEEQIEHLSKQLDIALAARDELESKFYSVRGAVHLLREYCGDLSARLEFDNKTYSSTKS